ncbi:MAG: LapA family protein [Burkholderiaceae bacterium]
MRILAWIFRFLLFLAALGFALSNTDKAELRFFGLNILFGQDLVWRAPLVIFLLVFFAGGVALGVLGVVPTLFRQRREIGRLRREARVAAKSGTGGVAQPPSPDVPGPAATAQPLTRP